MSGETPVISCRSVSKQFGAIYAVNDVSFAIERGAFFSLLGPSGCGKTTLLRLLAGFIAPTKGEIFIDNESMTYVPPNKRPTNMVFQNYAIFPHLNVFENIAYGLRSRGFSRSEMAKVVNEALELIKMTGYGSRRPNELSGGERQRVALARALVCRPKVLLLDEPLGALDKRLREEMQIELRTIQRAVGITFVLVTHDQEEALTMSDMIAVMSQGRILQTAAPVELYENPNCKEVASFIGSMNFFSGVVSGYQGKHILIDAGALGILRVSSRNEIPQNQRITGPRCGRRKSSLLGTCRSMRKTCYGGG